jgi:hypothetical protein
MWGHPSLLLRDIAVNESDQERVSDSGAIRSGLVPQLKHNAIHRRFPRLEEPLGDVPRLWLRHCNPRSRVNAPSAERKAGGCDSEHARPVVPGAGWCTQENVTRCAYWSPTICAAIGHRSRSIGCDAASCSDCHRADRHYLCTGDLLPGASTTMLFNQITLVSRPSRRHSPVATRTMAAKWAFAGLGGSGYLMPSEMHARLKALLERMAIDLNARLDPVSAIL